MSEWRVLTVEEKLDLIREIAADLQESTKDFDGLRGLQELLVVLRCVSSEAYQAIIRGEDRWLKSRRLYPKAG